MKGIIGYLLEGMREAINRGRERICSATGRYKDVVEAMFMDVVFDCERNVEAVREFRDEFIGEYGEDGETWYDGFRSEVTGFGEELAVEALVGRYLETHAEQEDGVYRLKLPAVPLGFIEDTDDVSVDLSYTPGLPCLAYARFNGSGEVSVYELCDMFEDYGDFERCL